MLARAVYVNSVRLPGFEKIHTEKCYFYSFLKGVVEVILFSLFSRSYFSYVDKHYVLILKVVKSRRVNL